ncbi:MAG: hypothetical protein SFV15_14310 [Polyangiaceae bacterium]|nr:hypothetical protein [Polyangiaceae bacterium]
MSDGQDQLGDQRAIVSEQRIGWGVRLGVTLICLLEAPVFIWGAGKLPWGSAHVFVSACWVLGALHAATALCAIFGRPTWLRLSWRALAYASLGALAGATWAIFTSAWYLATLYRSLGPGVAAALVAVWGLLVLLTLPLACWGLAVTRRGAAVNLRRLGALALALAFVCWGTASWAHSAQATPRPTDPTEVERVIRTALKGSTGNVSATPLAHLGPAKCPHSPAERELTLLVTFVARAGAQPHTACLQANSPAALARELEPLLSTQAERFPMAFDWVSATQPLDAKLSWIDLFKLRPGLDGVCDGGRCLVPWQLVARDRFMSAALGFDADARVGVDANELRRDLGSAEGTLSGLTRIETQSWVVGRDGALHPLKRGREVRRALDQSMLNGASERAKSYVVKAAQPDGGFRYFAQPFSGEEEAQSRSVARHAGTTLAFCELGGTDVLASEIAKKALAYLVAYATDIRDMTALPTPGTAQASLNNLALPLAAFLRCRPLVGRQFDRTIARLARALLHVQQSDGSFAPGMDVTRGEPLRGAKALYAEGQAVLALVWLEQLLIGEQRSTEALVGFPQLPKVQEAVGRALDYVSQKYWAHPLRNFFFLEENWHCLAARAALTVHRNDGYERFCLDYVRFKSRLVLAAGDVDAGLEGGYGIGTLSLPHTTATAGLGEALAAAIAIKRVRKEPVDADLALMRQVLGFLVMTQWNDDNCFACAQPVAALGGFSRHLASPGIRIDYVQHAWAAIGHGAALGLFEGS